MILTIVSIGPGDPSYLNEKTLKHLLSGVPLYLRTGQHPIVSWLNEHNISYKTLDHIYETTRDFDSLSEEIAVTLWQEAEKSENLVYAVSDPVTDHTVDILYLRRPKDSSIEVIPCFSYSDLYLPLCRTFFSTADIRICASGTFSISCDYDPSLPILITEIDSEIMAGEIKRILSLSVNDEEIVYFLDGSSRIKPIHLYDLDRQASYNHLSAVAAGSFPFTARRKKISDLMKIMNRLRDPDGCPWDRRQTHESLKPYVIEEAWEVSDAIGTNNPEHLAEELGDLLYQIVFHASIASSYDEFTLDDVIDSICEKIIRRHPHLFNNQITEKRSDADAVDIWDSIKDMESGSKTIAESMLHVSSGLPSLRYAEKILRKAGGYPFYKNPTAEEICKTMKEAADVLGAFSDHSEAKKCIGLILLCTAEYCRQSELDAEVILHETVRSVIQKFVSEPVSGSNDVSGTQKPLTFNDLGVY